MLLAILYCALLYGVSATTYTWFTPAVGMWNDDTQWRVGMTLVTRLVPASSDILDISGCCDAPSILAIVPAGPEERIQRIQGGLPASTSYVSSTTDFVVSGEASFTTATDVLYIKTVAFAGDLTVSGKVIMDRLTYTGAPGGCILNVIGSLQITVSSDLEDCTVTIDTTSGDSTLTVQDLVMVTGGGSIQEVGLNGVAKLSLSGTGSSLTQVTIGGNVADSVIDIDLNGASTLTFTKVTMNGGTIQEITGPGTLAVTGTDASTATILNDVDVKAGVDIQLATTGYLTITGTSAAEPFGTVGVNVNGPGFLYFTTNAWLSGVSIGATTAVPVQILTAAATTVTVTLTNVQMKDGSIQEATGSLGTGKLEINGVLTTLNGVTIGDTAPTPDSIIDINLAAAATLTMTKVTMVGGTITETPEGILKIDGGSLATATTFTDVVVDTGVAVQITSGSYINAIGTTFNNKALTIDGPGTVVFKTSIALTTVVIGTTANVVIDSTAGVTLSLTNVQ